jgi:hypothetical protein
VPSAQKQPCRPVGPSRRAARKVVRYRVSVAELVGEHATVVMDVNGAGFHTAVGELDGERLLVEHGGGGDPHRSGNHG